MWDAAKPVFIEKSIVLYTLYLKRRKVKFNNVRFTVRNYETSTNQAQSRRKELINIREKVIRTKADSSNISLN